MMKKIFAVLCAALVLCTAAGCGKKTESNGDAQVPVTENSSTEDTSAEGTDAASTGAENSTAGEETQTVIVTDGNGGSVISVQRVTTAQNGQTQAGQNGQTNAGQNAQTNAGQNGNTQPNQTVMTTITTTTRPPLPDTPTLTLESVQAKPGEEKVPVSLRIDGNTGYSACGITITYDPGLDPVLDPKDAENLMALCDVGPAGEGLMKATSVNKNERLIAIGTMGTEDNFESDVIMTFYFNVPANATAGQIYNVAMVVNSISNSKSRQMNPVVVNGRIEIV